MNFYRQQDKAKSSTFWLMILFCLSIATIASLLFVVALWHFPTYFCYATPDSMYKGATWKQRLCIDHLNMKQAIAFYSAVIGFLGMMSIYRYSQLASGGRVIAEVMGGRLLNTAKLNLSEKTLMNVVEEMAIASGVPVPLVYVIPSSSINAFAAGTEPKNAVIGVTQGSLDAFNRSEMQAVIGHEFSHILNGDMKLNMNLIGICYGLLGFYQVGRSMLRSGSRGRGKNAGQLFIIAGALMILGLLGYFFGCIIQAAVSRQREFLADASSVQFTRNPSSMSGALKKIAAFGSVLRTSNTSEVSHMLFADGVSRMIGGIFATHPPLLERIKKIEPNYKQSQLDQLTSSSFTKVVHEDSAASANPAMSGLTSGAAFKPSVPAELPVNTVVSPAELIATTGQVQAQGEAAATELLSELDAETRAMTREPYGARAIVFALLLNDDHTASAQLKDVIARYCGPDVVRLVEKVTEKLIGKENLRLPLVDLCMPSLRSMSVAQLQTFLECLQRLIEIDKQVEIFEFTLFTVVKSNLARNAKLRMAKTIPVITDGQAIARLVAAVIHGSKSSVEDPLGPRELEVYRAHLKSFPNAQHFMNALPTWDVALFEAALLRAATYNFKQKKFLLEHLASVAAADGIIDVREVEIIRSIADRLSCPIPPTVLQPRQIAVA